MSCLIAYYGEQVVLDKFPWSKPLFFRLSGVQSVHYFLLGVISSPSINACLFLMRFVPSRIILIPPRCGCSPSRASCSTAVSLMDIAPGSSSFSTKDLSFLGCQDSWRHPPGASLDVGLIPVLHLTLWRPTALPHPSTHGSGQRLDPGTVPECRRRGSAALLDTTEDPQHA